MKLSSVDAKNRFTKRLLAAYRERPEVMAFFQSFFKEVVESTFALSIEVERGTEKIAVDVLRGTEGNRNNFDVTSEKMFIPPFYREFFDATQLSLYDRMFGSSELPPEALFAGFINQLADKMAMCRDKIKRRYELQCAQVFLDGIVTLEKGINIDFKRKAASMQDLSATPWTDSNNNPFTMIENGAKFLRNYGKSQGGSVNVIFGENAWNAFLYNNKVTSRADIRNFNLDNITGPQKNSVGANLNGVVTTGNHNAFLWTYPEIYENAAGDHVNYMDPDKIIVLPTATPKFILGFAAVPQLIDETNPVPRKGAFIYGDYKDERNATHDYDVKSAGVAIPVAVDQIYTAKVVA